DLKTQVGPLLENSGDNEIVNFKKGIYYCDKPVSGELGFVFTDAAGVYPGMGGELLLAMPELLEDFAKKFDMQSEAIDRLYRGDKDSHGFESMLWASSFLSQIHAIVSREYFGLNPEAAIGFSSGESNSLFAMGAWRDMSRMAGDLHEEGVFTRKIGGEFEAIKSAWKTHDIADINWENWGLYAPRQEVEAALEGETLVHLTIVSAGDVVVIGGQREACARVIEKIGKTRAQLLPYSIANHCPELHAY
ncbi:MAG: hypothetical protein GY854_31310, partial [Deltaproteobacteria bacterium]|nr:hypothetical protein [Deltaproteobacteria bacterium]